MKAEDWALFINICASVTGFLKVFPHRMEEFISLVPTLCLLLANKTDMLRKNVAVLIAKLASNEVCKKEIVKHHGLEVLMSLKGKV